MKRSILFPAGPAGLFVPVLLGVLLFGGVLTVPGAPGVFSGEPTFHSGEINAPLEAVNAVVPGDVNQDGLVDDADYAILLQWLAERGKALVNARAADLDQDKRIDASDLVLLGILINAAPTISDHPLSSSLCPGGRATLIVRATGTDPLHYAWYQGDKGNTATPAPGAADHWSYSTPELASTTQYWCRVSNLQGVADSNAATITVYPLTAIGVHPNDQTLCTGSTATLTITATGMTLSYQWYRGAAGDLSNPVGANSPVYTTPALVANTSYWVRVTGDCGMANSQTATVTITPTTVITAHPTDTVIASGQTATLTVEATGTGTLAYQWYQGASGVTTTPVGTNSPSFITPPLTAATRYWCRVTGTCGTAGSNVAMVLVTSSEQPGDLIGLDPVVGNMRYFPGGSFTQGSPVDEPCRGSDEQRFTHTLTQPFALMETEVTRQMWANLKSAQPTLPPDPTNLSYGSGANNPVQQVTWPSAVLFANLLSVRNGLTRCYYTDPAFTTPITSANYTTGPYYCNWAAEGYRLPSEGEREYVCRAGTSGAFFVDEPNYTADNCSEMPTLGLYPSLETVAWFNANSGQTTHPVGMKEANPWNLKDIHGNVREWCWDLYALSYPSGSATDYHGASTGASRVIRDSGWIGMALGCRSASRGSLTIDLTDVSIGFRLARRFVAKSNE